TLFRSSLCIGLIGKYFCRKMLHRFSHAEIHQTDSHSCGKKHSYPGEEGMFGFAVIGSEPDVSILAEDEINQKNNKNSDCPNIYPVEVDENKIFAIIQKICCKSRKNSRD